MKPLTRNRFLFAFLPMVLLTSVSDAAIGGSEGGGNPIASAFKAKVIALVEKSSNLLLPARESLQFDPGQLAILLKTPGRFQVQCAPQDRADQMRSNGNMAEVFADARKTVFLDCIHYSQAEWEDLLKSTDPAQESFFLHEALRVLGKEEENDYTLSASFVSAMNKQLQLRKSLAQSILQDSVGRTCSTEIRFDRHHLKLSMSVWVERKGFLNPSELVYQTNLDVSAADAENFHKAYHQELEALKASFSNLEKNKYSDAFEKVLDVVQKIDHCWDGVVKRFVRQDTLNQADPAKQSQNRVKDSGPSEIETASNPSGAASSTGYPSR